MSALDVMLDVFSDGASLDAAIVRILDEHMSGPKRDCADEVLPDDLAALVRGLATHAAAPQVGGRAAEESGAEGSLRVLRISGVDGSRRGIPLCGWMDGWMNRCMDGFIKVVKCV